MSHVDNSSMSLRQIMTLVENEKAKFTELQGSAGQVAGKTSDESIHASTEYKDTLEAQESQRKDQAKATLVLTGISGALNGAASVGLAGGTAYKMSTNTAAALGGFGQSIAKASGFVLEPLAQTATGAEQSVISKKMAGLQADGSELQSAVSSLGETAGNTVDEMSQLTDVGGNIATKMRQAVADINEASTQPNDR